MSTSQPRYAVPLVVRYDSLVALISANIDSAIKGLARPISRGKKVSGESSDLWKDTSRSTGRTGALNNVLFKLRQWVNKLSYESPTKVTAGPDVLEALEASDIEFIYQIHGIFSNIATRVNEGILENTVDWDSWYQSLNKSLLQELDNLVWPLRDEYVKCLGKSGLSPPRSSLVLCLDGGGVRSFSSLLILQTLMNKVRDIIREKNLPDDPLEILVRPRDFFDYIFGTSSGGMIAVMLGRLQMTVDECISSFKEFGNGTFARPRLLHNYTFLLLGRSKYGEGTIHKIIQSVVNKYIPGDENANKRQQHTFAALGDKCKTGVWACASQSLGSQPRLFRTYNHDFPVWSVARATSAAPYLFDEVVIEGTRFVDGGLVINNPCPESYFEVDCLHQQRLQQKDAQEGGIIDSKQQSSPSVAVLVSIGSGLRPLPKSRSKVGVLGMDRVTGLIDRLVWAAWTSTERAHEQMERDTWQTETSYYRFNVEEGIGSVRQDEWKKRNHNNETLNLIENKTRQYIEQKEVDQQLQKCAEQLVRLRRKQL